MLLLWTDTKQTELIITIISQLQLIFMSILRTKVTAVWHDVVFPVRVQFTILSLRDFALYQSIFTRAISNILADLAWIIALWITFLVVYIHFRRIYYLSTADLEALIGFWRHNINKPLLKVADTNSRGYV